MCKSLMARGNGRSYYWHTRQLSNGVRSSHTDLAGSLKLSYCTSDTFRRDDRSASKTRFTELSLVDEKRLHDDGTVRYSQLGPWLFCG